MIKAKIGRRINTERIGKKIYLKQGNYTRQVVRSPSIFLEKVYGGYRLSRNGKKTRTYKPGELVTMSIPKNNKKLWGGN